MDSRKSEHVLWTIATLRGVRGADGGPLPYSVPAEPSGWLNGFRAAAGLTALLGSLVLQWLFGGVYGSLLSVCFLGLWSYFGVYSVRSEYVLSRVLIRETGRDRVYESRRGMLLYGVLMLVRPALVFLVCFQSRYLWLLPAAVLPGWVSDERRSRCPFSRWITWAVPAGAVLVIWPLSVRLSGFPVPWPTAFLSLTSAVLFGLLSERSRWVRGLPEPAVPGVLRWLSEVLFLAIGLLG